MKIAVTGASGFIGRYVIPLLLGNGHEVCAIAHRSPADEIPDVRWIAADLLDERQCQAAVQSARADCLLHLAWYAVHGKFWTAPENFAWVRASSNLLEAFIAGGGKRAVIAGTCAEYDWSYGYCVEDLTPTRPATLYGRCKDATRQLSEAMCEASATEFAWGRIFFPYGVGEPGGRLLPSVLRSLSRNEPVLCSHGEQYRDFLHVEDVARAFVHLVESGQATGAFNIASGQPVRLADLVMKCVGLHRPGVQPEFGAVAVAPDDPPLLVGSPRKLMDTGWAPRIALDDGIRRLIREHQTTMEKK